MRIYLDNCCFNRPFDDQSQLRIRLESEAKLRIQEEVLEGTYQLIWSYVLDYENSRNPFQERREQISRWRAHANEDISESREIITCATKLAGNGLKNMDALHIACAMDAKAVYFVTTDDTILKKATRIQNIRVTDPIGFIREVMI